jgi:hypothetical protein
MNTADECRSFRDVAPAAKEIAMPPSGSQKFAVLLCRFKDAPNDEPHPASWYSDLVNEGHGGLADYWRDASLGHIDLKGSSVYGWTTLDVTRDDFVNSHPSRRDKIDGAIAAFPASATSGVTGVIAVFNRSVTDSAASGNGVLCGPDDPSVTFLGHETGHVFGLEHSFDTSSRKDADWSQPGEYFDRLDIMSAMNVDSLDGQTFSPVGPLLATPNLDRMGWLDTARVWTPSSANSSSVEELELVSLGHPEIPGYLAVRIGELYVEFRTQDGWDAGISRPAVLIHRLVDPNAVVLASDPTNYVNDWQPGQTYGPSSLELAIRGGTQITIVSFDLSAKKARIRVLQAARPPVSEVGPGAIFGGVGVDGGGIIVLPSGKVVRVPPGWPAISVLEKLAVLTDTQVLSPISRRAVEAAVLEDVARTARQLGEEFQD